MEKPEFEPKMITIPRIGGIDRCFDFQSRAAMLRNSQNERKSGWPGHDDSSCGAYFIPVCAKERHEILWTVGATSGRPQESCNVGSASGRPQDPTQFSEYGKIIQNEIERIDEIFDHIAAGRRRATKGRPYSFAHYPAVQGFGSKTNRGFNLAGLSAANRVIVRYGNT